MDDLVIPKTLHDYCEAREQAISKFDLAERFLSEGQSILEQCANYLWPYDAKLRMNRDDFVKEIDKRLWRTAFDKTGLFQFMDAEGKRKFDDDLEHNPPVFTLDNIRSTLLTVAQDADMMFARGLVNVFRRLSKEHRTNTNEPFKVNRRAILPGMVRPVWSGGLQINYYSGGSEQINDIDRVFCTLDGKQHHPRSLETAMNAVFEKYEPFENEYYAARAFRNGNLHITFKREDLLEKANKIIGAYYDGHALAKARK